jgi:chromosome segregation ATPase
MEVSVLLVTSEVKLKNGKGKRKDYTESSKDRREDLRGEIRRLRKEVLQLRRENAKLLGRDMELQELLEEVVIEEVIITKPSCPKCGHRQIKVLEKLRGDIDYFFCENPSCQHKGRMKDGKPMPYDSK